jgi:hypothetical protein
MSPVDEEDELHSKQGGSVHLRINSSEEDLTQKLSGSETEETNAEDLTPEKIYSMEEETAAALELPMSSRLSSLSSKLANLEIPERHELYDTLVMVCHQNRRLMVTKQQTKALLLKRITWFQRRNRLMNKMKRVKWKSFLKNPFSKGSVHIKE